MGRNPPEVFLMEQFRYQIDTERLLQTLRKLGLTQATALGNRPMGELLLKAIADTLEHAPVHSFEHWGDRGWWYHGTMTDEDWVLVRLKFFD
jgi:hypothetical protein